MNLKGDINTYFSAIGEKQGDLKVLNAISLIASDFEVERFECDAYKSTYFHFFKRGVGFTFVEKDESEVLESIFFYVNGSQEYNRYPFLDDFILDLKLPYCRASIINFLGKPEKESTEWIRYLVNNKYLHFEFDSNGQIVLVTLFEM